jgi:pimeloyl-ACP methyl ester carboxylesterase
MRRFMMVIGGVLIALAILTGVFVATTWAPERTVEELRARWAPAPSVFLNVAGMRVHMRDEGPRDDASPVVLLHGTASSLHTWDGWTEALRSKRRVIRFDLSGFGLTGPSPDGIYGVEDDVRLVIAVLDHLGIERCVLGGNSLGGSIALRAALTHPARVDKLILVDSGGYPTRPTSMPIAFYLARLPMFGWVVGHILPRGLVEQGLRNVYGDPSKVTPELVDRSRELTQRAGNRRALIERGRQRRPSNVAHRIAELKLPTLIIWGGQDRLIPPDTAHRFHHDIAGSTLAIFDDLGHVPQEEDPVRTAAAVKQFLGLE